MKTFILPVIVTVLLCSCEMFGPPREYTTIKVSWPPGTAYVPVCKTLVKYQATSVEVKGVTIPVPQLGGSAQVGGVAVDPKVLNQAYQTTQILDTYYHSTCALLPAYSTDKEKFENAVQGIQDSETKLTQLALSLQTAQQPAATPAAQPAPSPAAPPTASPAAKPAPSPASQPAAKAKAVKHRLANWVASYSKKSKAAIVKTPAKPNTALGLPPTAPTPAPLPR
jgi:hypothetical protein